MRYWIAAALALIVSSLWFAPVPAQAQTPPHICTGGVSWHWVIFGGYRPDETPCSNGINTELLNEFYLKLKDAKERIDALPEEIKDAGPTAQTLEQGLYQAREIMGYAKWLFSPASAQELLGKTLAPIGITSFVLLTQNIALAVIYLTINAVIFTFRMIMWLINQIIKILPFY